MVGRVKLFAESAFCQPRFSRRALCGVERELAPVLDCFRGQAASVHASRDRFCEVYFRGRYWRVIVEMLAHRHESIEVSLNLFFRWPVFLALPPAFVFLLAHLEGFAEGGAVSSGVSATSVGIDYNLRGLRLFLVHALEVRGRDLDGVEEQARSFLLDSLATSS